jgi:hypothetical protein
MVSQSRLPIAVAMLFCLMVAHTVAAHRHVLQEVPAAAGPAAAAPETLPTPPAHTTDSVDDDPELNPTATSGGRAGYDYPDRIPGPPELDPSRQGMYKGKYRWAAHLSQALLLGSNTLKPTKGLQETHNMLSSSSAHSICSLSLCVHAGYVRTCRTTTTLDSKLPPSGSRAAHCMTAC